jgi:hypothetical protein
VLILRDARHRTDSVSHLPLLSLVRLDHFGEPKILPSMRIDQ